MKTLAPLATVSTRASFLRHAASRGCDRNAGHSNAYRLNPIFRLHSPRLPDFADDTSDTHRFNHFLVAGGKIGMPGRSVTAATLSMSRAAGRPTQNISELMGSRPSHLNLAGFSP